MNEQARAFSEYAANLDARHKELRRRLELCEATVVTLKPMIEDLTAKICAAMLLAETQQKELREELERIELERSRPPA